MAGEHRHSVDEIIAASRRPDASSVEVFEDGRWVVAKPLSYDEPIGWRLRRWITEARIFVRTLVTLRRNGTNGEGE